MGLWHLGLGMSLSSLSEIDINPTLCGVLQGVPGSPGPTGPSGEAGLRGVEVSSLFCLD